MVGEEFVRVVCSNRVMIYCMDVIDVDQVREVFESVKKEILVDEGNFDKRFWLQFFVFELCLCLIKELFQKY